MSCTLIHTLVDIHFAMTHDFMGHQQYGLCPTTVQLLERSIEVESLLCVESPKVAATHWMCEQPWLQVRGSGGGRTFCTCLDWRPAPGYASIPGCR